MTATRVKGPGGMEYAKLIGPDNGGQAGRNIGIWPGDLIWDFAIRTVSWDREQLVLPSMIRVFVTRDGRQFGAKRGARLQGGDVVRVAWREGDRR